MQNVISKIKDAFIFLGHSVRNFREMGSVAPSSNFLAKRLTRPIIYKSGVIIVELGAGTGSVTKYISEKLPKDGILLVFEKNTDMAKILEERYGRKNIIVLADDAKNINKHLEKMRLGKADHIVSGLPMGNFSKEDRKRIIRSVQSSLAPHSTYTQFQYFLANILEFRREFTMTHIAYEWRNLPPAFVYTCRI